LQAKPLHEVVDCAPQLPLPLHCAARVSVPPAQLCAAQVEVGYEQVALEPLQEPWQVPVPAQAGREPCG
jgi:hypothetical protein